MKNIFFVFVLIALQTNAQKLTLPDAINLALKNSFDIQIAKNVVEVNKLNNNIGIAGGLPTVTATATNQESIVNINQKLNTGTEITRDGAASNSMNANITGTMLLYNGYRVVTTKKRLDLLQQQSQQNLNAQIQNTIASVMINYCTVVKQQWYIRTLKQSIELSKQQLSLIKNKQGVGLANNAQIFQAEIDVNTRTQELLSQELLLSQYTTDLLNTIQIKPDSVVLIEDTILVDNKLNLSDVLQGVEKNPQITSLNSQIKINEFLEKEINAQKYPSLRANTGINYGRNQSNGGQLLLNQSYGPFVGVTISVPLFSWGIINRLQQIAKINTNNAKLQKESVTSNIHATIVKMYQAYLNSLQQLLSQQKNYNLAKQLVDISLQRFQLSSATIIEVREAQKSFEEASYRLTNLCYIAKLAEIELKRISNALTN